MKPLYLAIALCVFAALALADIVGAIPARGIGAADNGAYRISVTDIDTVSFLGAGPSRISDGPYLCFHLVIENITSPDADVRLGVNAYDFRLVYVDAKGVRYDVAMPVEVGTAIGSQGDGFAADTLAPGQKTTGVVAFPLPQLSAQSARIDGALFDCGTYDPIYVALPTSTRPISWGVIKSCF